eukprot:tig00000792_g4193.t1
MEVGFASCVAALPARHAESASGPSSCSCNQICRGPFDDAERRGFSGFQQTRSFFVGSPGRAVLRFSLQRMMRLKRRGVAQPSGGAPSFAPRATVDDTGGSSGPSGEPESPEDAFHVWRRDRVSEAIGYQFLADIAGNPYVNREAVVAGIQKALDGEPSPLGEDDYNKALFQMEQKAYVDDCIKEGLDPETEIKKGYKQRMAQAVQDRAPDEAIDLLDNMAASWGVQPDVEIFNCLLLWLLDAGELWRAMLVFRRMLRTMRPSKETYDILLGAMGMNYAELPASFTEVIARARATGVPPRVRVYWLPPAAPESTSLEVLFSLEHVMGPRADNSDLLARFGGPVPTAFREAIPEACAGRVTELLSPTGARVLLFGHDHTAESKAAMAALIRSQRPDTVMVELCRERVALLESRDEFPLIAWLFPDPAALPVAAVRAAIGLGKRLGADMRGLLESLTPGIEFREAAALAEEVGAEIFLGDRPWTLTLERAMAGCSQEDRRAFLSHLFGSISQFDEATRREVEAEQSAARAGKGAVAVDPATGERPPIGSPLSGGSALQGARRAAEAEAAAAAPRGAAALSSAAAAAAAMASLEARRRIEEARAADESETGVPILSQRAPMSLVRSTFNPEPSPQPQPQPQQQQQQLVTLIQNSPLTPASAPILPPDPFSALPEVAAAEAAAAQEAAVRAAIAAAAEANAEQAEGILEQAEAEEAEALREEARAELDEEDEEEEGGEEDEEEDEEEEEAGAAGLTVGEAAAAGAISGHPELTQDEFDAWVKAAGEAEQLAEEAAEAGRRPAEGGDSLLRRVDGGLAEQWPQAYGALVTERDAYMGDVVRSLTGPTVVAVVGSSHVPGILARWHEPLVSRFIMQHIESAMGRLNGGGSRAGIQDPSLDL